MMLFKKKDGSGAFRSSGRPYAGKTIFDACQVGAQYHSAEDLDFLYPLPQGAFFLPEDSSGGDSPAVLSAAPSVSLSRGQPAASATDTPWLPTYRIDVDTLLPVSSVYAEVDGARLLVAAAGAEYLQRTSPAPMALLSVTCDAYQ